MLTKEQAEQRGNLLFNKLRGEGWQVDVWENDGWHYAVTNGPLRVTSAVEAEKPEDCTFMCLMDSDRHSRCIAGHMDWSTNYTSKYPLDVVLNQVREARRVLNVYIDAVEYMERVMEIEP